MTTYSSASLLTMFNQYAGRPTADAITDAEKYARLARAQNVVLEDLAARIPQAQYSHAAYASTPTLTTTDNQVFTFGTDSNGDALFPIGKTGIYPSLSSIPDSAWVEGQDYLWEGSQIRIPNNGVYTGTLYWRGIAPAITLNATDQPIINPPPARVLIVFEAVRSFAVEWKRDADLAQLMATEYGLSFSRWCLTLKTATVNRTGAGPVTGLRLAQAGY